MMLHEEWDQAVKSIKEDEVEEEQLEFELSEDEQEELELKLDEIEEQAELRIAEEDEETLTAQTLLDISCQEAVRTRFTTKHANV